MTPESFFKLYYYSAVLCERSTKIPALSIMAQAALESAWGEKTPGNMVFGIKAGPSWKGKKQLISTTEIHNDGDRKKHPYPEIISITQYTDDKGRIRFRWKVKDWFRAYVNVAESFADHGQFLLSQPRYAKAFETVDPRKFVEIIATAGYATDPEYANTLKKIIGMLEKFLPFAKN
jgi:flagellar protein FlgJ